MSREFQISDVDFNSDNKFTVEDVDIIQDIYNNVSNGNTIQEVYQRKLQDVFQWVYGDDTIILSRIEALLTFSRNNCKVHADNEKFNDDDMNKVDVLFQRFKLWASMNPSITDPSLIEYFEAIFEDSTEYTLKGDIKITTQWLINVFYHSEKKKSSHIITEFNYFKPWTEYYNDDSAKYISNVEKPLQDLYKEIFNIYDVVSVSKTLTVLKHDSKSDPTLYINIKEGSKINCTYTWFKSVSGSWQEIDGANSNEYRIPNEDINIETSEFFTPLYYKVRLQDSNGSLSYRDYELFVYLLDFDNENTLWGDINNDGVVNILDIYRLKKLFNLRIGDTNFDNKVDSGDASDILSTYAKLSTTTDSSMTNCMNIIYGILENKNNPEIRKAVDYFGKDLLKPAMPCIMDYSYAKNKTDDYELYGLPIINAEDASLVMADYSGTSTTGETPNYTLSNSNYSISVVSEIMARGLVMLDREPTRRKELISAHLYKILQAIKNKDVKLT